MRARACDDTAWLLAGVVALSVCVACETDGGAGFQPPSPPRTAPLAAEVDPFIGTDGEPPNDGQTFPGAVVPWGMASPSPHTTLTTPADAADGVFANAGYRYGAPSMRGFGLTHLSGVGCPDLGLPVVAPVVGEAPLDPSDYVSSYRNEVAYAGYYAVELGERGTIAEMTATPRTGVFRFRFPRGAPAHIVVDPARGVSWSRGRGEVTELRGDEIAGSAGYGAFCAIGDGGRLYFSARPDPPADRVSLVEVSDRPGEAMAVWHYDSVGDAPVTLWVGLSYVGLDQARENLLAEQLPFDDARDTAAQTWHDRLGRVEVEGGSSDDRTRFYTALYHTLLHPSIVHDVTGTYPQFERDDVGQSDGAPRHTVFSLWDTYRTLHPLLTLLYPEVQRQMLHSMEDMVIGAQVPPKWELLAEEVQMMVGDPAGIVFADSHAKGLTGVDYDAVLDVLLDAAERDDHRPGNESYQELGFVPMELANDIWGPVSTTLEYAVADWALAELSDALGRDADGDRLADRAASYAGFYDAETGTLRPRNADGSFLEPFDPDAIEGSLPLRLGGPGYVEGTAWQYAFFVPHDVEGLVALHGEALFLDRLRWVFDTDRFVMWNEPDMHYPYLFTFLDGEGAGTQREARAAMERYFTTEPDGLPGNDDTGAMSAWFVFSAMGFYPVTPGVPEYRLGSPLFERITIRLSESLHDGETFVIDAPDNGPDSVYVHEARLDGRPLDAPVLPHAAITAGGMLELDMSAELPSADCRDAL